jgi:hypothetical protein
LGESQFQRGAYTVVLFICTYFVVSVEQTPLSAGRHTCNCAWGEEGMVRRSRGVHYKWDKRKERGGKIRWKEVKEMGEIENGDGILERHFQSRFLGINSSIIRLEVLSDFLPSFFCFTTRYSCFADFFVRILKKHRRAWFSLISTSRRKYSILLLTCCPRIPSRERG